MWGNRTSSWVLGTLGVFSVLGAVGLATAAPAGATTPPACSADSTGSSGTCTLYTPNGTFNADGSVSYSYSGGLLTLTVSGTGPITAGPWLCLGSADMSAALLEPASECTPNGPLATGPGQSLVQPSSSSGDTFVFQVPSGDFWFMHLGADGNTLEAAATNAVSAPSDPGSNNPGSNNPGTNDPGTNDPGTNNPPSNSTPGGSSQSSSGSSPVAGTGSVNSTGTSDPGSSAPGDPAAGAATSSDPQIPVPASAPQAVAGATNIHTGEPFAGSKPFEVALAAGGFVLLGVGALKRRRARAC